jgi:hypothetical protein
MTATKRDAAHAVRSEEFFVTVSVVFSGRSALVLLTLQYDEHILLVANNASNCENHQRN